MEDKLKKEFAAFMELLEKQDGNFDYTFQVRSGEIYRTILSTVYNGTDFQD